MLQAEQEMVANERACRARKEHGSRLRMHASTAVLSCMVHAPFMVEVRSFLSAPTWKYGRGPERAAHRGVDSDDLPIYKPALDEVVKRGRGRNLFLSTEVQGAIKCRDGRPRSVRRVVVQLHLFLQ